MTTGFDLRTVRVFRLFRLFRIFKLFKYGTAIDRLVEAFAEIKKELIIVIFLRLGRPINLSMHQIPRKQMLEP